MNEFEEKLRTVDNDDCYVWAQTKSIPSYSDKYEDRVNKEIRRKIVRLLNLVRDGSVALK